MRSANEMEYIKLTDEESCADDGMPYIWFFEVNPQNDRLQERSIEVDPSGRVQCMTKEEYLDSVIELVPVPTAEELNQGIWGETQHAELISKEQFEALWNAQPGCLPQQFGRLSEEAES